MPLPELLVHQRVEESTSCRQLSSRESTTIRCCVLHRLFFLAYSYKYLFVFFFFFCPNRFCWCHLPGGAPSCHNRPRNCKYRRASSSCIQAVEDAHSASSDVTSAGLRGKFGPELQYIMQHTACSRQRRDMWVGSFCLERFITQLSLKQLKRYVYFFTNPASSPLSILKHITHLG